MVFDINALIHKNLTSKWKLWALIIVCKWESVMASSFWSGWLVPLFCNRYIKVKCDVRYFQWYVYIRSEKLWRLSVLFWSIELPNYLITKQLDNLHWTSTLNFWWWGPLFAQFWWLRSWLFWSRSSRKSCSYAYQIWAGQFFSKYLNKKQLQYTLTKKSDLPNTSVFQVTINSVRIGFTKRVLYLCCIVGKDVL